MSKTYRYTPVVSKPEDKELSGRELKRLRREAKRHEWNEAIKKKALKRNGNHLNKEAA